MIQVIITSDERGNCQFFQDGCALGAFTVLDAQELVRVLRTGGAQVTDLRAAPISAADVASI